MVSIHPHAYPTISVCVSTSTDLTGVRFTLFHFGYYFPPNTKKVIATMMSLSSTHIILHYHRKVHYHPPAKANSDNVVASADNHDTLELGHQTKVPSERNSTAEEPGHHETTNAGGLGLSHGFVCLAIAALVVSAGFFLAGVTTPAFEVTSTRGPTSETTAYSIRSIGMAIPGAYIEKGHAGTRFIQWMWFFLGIAAPLVCSALFFLLFAIPSLSRAWIEIIFAAAESAFAWR